MAVKIKIDPLKKPPEGLPEITPPARVEVALEIRKTLDGKIMILDHLHMDIILDTTSKQILTFPKTELNDEVYDSQNNYFKYLIAEGVVLPESIQGGNVYGSIQGTYPQSSDEKIDSAQVIILSTKKFLEESLPALVALDKYEDTVEDHYSEPTSQDSTELGTVPEEPKKGNIPPYRIRRYLGGYGYYE